MWIWNIKSHNIIVIIKKIKYLIFLVDVINNCLNVFVNLEDDYYTNEAYYSV
jgi:hypothetical protein